MNSRVIEMQGARYGAIVAVQIAGKASSGDLKWQFRCDCGGVFEANGYYARSGKIDCCPACSAERVRQASLKHGRTETPEFSTWTDIQTRCYNPNIKGFANYGGRGIRVCDRWLESFENFLADMGPRPEGDYSIERENNDGHYEPSNCRWATRIEQANNRRTNVKVTIDGVTKNLQAWALEHGVELSTASLRHKQGLRGEALFKTTKTTLTHNGITDTVRGWSDRTGIKPTTISMRINHYHWPVSKALTQGASL